MFCLGYNVSKDVRVLLKYGKNINFNETMYRVHKSFLYSLFASIPPHPPLAPLQLVVLIKSALDRRRPWWSSVRNYKKNISATTEWIMTKLGRKNPMVDLFQSCENEFGVG